MKQVSNKYIESMKQTIRNPSCVEVTIYKPEADETDFHDIMQDFEEGEHRNIVGTLSRKYMLDSVVGTSYLWTGDLNQFILGDNISIAEDSIDCGKFGGYIDSEKVLEYQGSLSSPILEPITIPKNVKYYVNLERPKKITHLQLIPRLDYAKTWDWDKYTVTIMDSDGETYHYENTPRGIFIEREITTDTIVIEATGLEIPFGGRVKFEKLIIGYAEEFTNDDILDCNVINEVDPLSRRLPKHELELNVADYDGRYDPSNPKGMYDAFDGGEKVRYRYGYDIGGAIEWLPDEWYYLKQKPTFNSNKANITADKFDVNWLDKPCLFTQYNFANRESMWYAMYGMDLTTARINFNQNLFKSYASPKTTKGENIKDILQLIANYTGCAFYMDKDCKAVIERFSDMTTIFELSDADVIMNTVSASVNPKLSQLVGNLYSYKEDGTEKVITTLESADNFNIVDYGGVYRFTRFTEGDTEVFDSEHTSLYGKQVRYHFGEIKGIPIRIENIGVAYSLGNDGVEQTLDNYMFTSREDLDKTCNEVWLPYLKKQLVFELDYRGNPELEVGDVFYFKDKYGTNRKVRLLSNKITFNGAIRGHMIVKEI